MLMENDLLCQTIRMSKRIDMGDEAKEQDTDFDAINRVDPKESNNFDKNLEKAIVRKQWMRVESILTKQLKNDIADTDNEKEKKKKITQSSIQCCLACNKTHSLTHTLCRFRAPVHILSMAVDSNSLSLFQVDCLGKLPLHVAAENGASPQVIEYLCARCPTVALHQDSQGRVPLHLACEAWESRCDCESDEEAMDDFEKVIETLIEASPKSLLIEDSEDMTPLECAIETEADFTIVRMLQKATKEFKSGTQNGVQTTKERARAA